MLLKADRLADLLITGANDSTDPFVISPSPDLPALQKSGAASVDLRLGTWFLTLREARMSHLDVDESGANAKLTKSHYVPLAGTYFLHPGSFVLATTLEWMRFPEDKAAYVVGRSSWGRRGLIIATATGVHPGFKGCLTLELTNVGKIPISIKPGMAICQIFVHDVEQTSKGHVDQSTFVGLRRPILGKLKLDKFSEALRAAYSQDGVE